MQRFVLTENIVRYERLISLETDVARRRRIAPPGGSLFEILPDNPDNPDADGVGSLYASLRGAAQSRQPHLPAVQRYDMGDQRGQFTERYWHLVNAPILSEDGEPNYFPHQAEDVTDQVMAARA